MFEKFLSMMKEKRRVVQAEELSDSKPKKEFNMFDTVSDPKSEQIEIVIPAARTSPSPGLETVLRARFDSNPGPWSRNRTLNTKRPTLEQKRYAERSDSRRKRQLAYYTRFNLRKTKAA